MGLTEDLQGRILDVLKDDAWTLELTARRLELGIRAAAAAGVRIMDIAIAIDMDIDRVAALVRSNPPPARTTGPDEENRLGTEDGGLT